ncbi:hypothetical protein GCM10009795_040130 [Nocardioides hankookensis]|uniref:Uncharacterized protein n=1 Tax=Nocardioides hankookensis TaxID=443157 RepID=A0ABW1LQJ8_9ACTN
MPTTRIPGDPRGTRAWRVLRDQVVDEEPTCRLRLIVCTGDSETADHIVRVVDDVTLAMERSNLRGSCNACNLYREKLLRQTGIDVVATTRLELAPDALGFFE